VDEAIRQQEQMQQQQEQLRQELEREHKDGFKKPPESDDLILPKVPPAVPGAPCFKADSIELKGVTLLSHKESNGLIAPYLERCLTLNDVNNLVRDITNAYIAKGFVTTRVAVPEQDFSTGNLILLVIEGKVEDIEYKQGQGSPRELKGAFPGISGSYLNLRDIEQGVDQMNRLPSNNAKMQLAPGNELGTSKIVVTNERKRTWRASIGADNSGQESTGRNQYVLAFAKDNLLNINDLLNFTMNGDSEALWNGEHQKSGTYNTFYSVPLGYWTFTGSWSRYNYRTSIESSGVDYSSYGNTTTTSLAADRVFNRGQNSKSSVDVSLTHRDTQNYFSGEKLSSTSYVLSVLSLSLNHSHRLLNGVAQGRLGYSHGVPILGAERDRTPSHDTPRSQFSKITFSGSYYRPIQCEGTNLYWSTRLSGQWAPHTLYSAERFSIGSQYTVRGFHDDSISGDTGAYVRNELGINLPLSQRTHTNAADWFGTTQLYAGYDAGFIHRDPKEDKEKGSLQGAAMGIRTSGGSLVMNLVVSRPLDSPSFVSKRELETYFSIKYAF